MRQRITLTCLASIALGIILTMTFIAQMTWNSFGDCTSIQNQVLPASIRRVDCSGLAYGFPYKFIQSKPRLDINFISEQNTSPLMLGVSSKTEIDKVKLLLNVLFWSVISGTVMGVIQYKIRLRKPSKNKE